MFSYICSRAHFKTAKILLKSACVITIAPCDSLNFFHAHLSRTSNLQPICAYDKGADASVTESYTHSPKHGRTFENRLSLLQPSLEHQRVGIGSSTCESRDFQLPLTCLVPVFKMATATNSTDASPNNFETLPERCRQRCVVIVAVDSSARPVRHECQMLIRAKL